MPVKVYRPTSPGRRDMSGFTFEEITRTKPERSLLAPLRSTGGRNNNGVLTVRHRGGGHKRRYRIIDFRRDKFDVAGKVESIEYDPNRSARIALVVYTDGERRYILAPVGLHVGDTVMSGADAEIRRGNALPIRSIPLGTVDPQHRALSGTWRTIGAQRRKFCSVAGQGRQHGADSPTQR